MNLNNLRAAGDGMTFISIRHRKTEFTVRERERGGGGRLIKNLTWNFAHSCRSNPCSELSRWHVNQRSHGRIFSFPKSRIRHLSFNLRKCVSSYQVSYVDGSSLPPIWTPDVWRWNNAWPKSSETYVAIDTVWWWSPRRQRNQRKISAVKSHDPFQKCISNKWANADGVQCTVCSQYTVFHMGRMWHRIGDAKNKRCPYCSAA